MSYWHCEKCGGIPGVTHCCTSDKPAQAPSVTPVTPVTPAASNVVQLDDHRPHLTFTTHANTVHVIPLSFWMDVAKGHLSIDNLGEHRDSLLRVVVAEWLSMQGLATPEQLLTKEIQPCPEDS